MITASSGTQALSYLSTASQEGASERLVDLMFIEPRLLNGDELQAIKTALTETGGKLVALTASALSQGEAKSRVLGFDDYMIKPFMFDDLYDCIARQLKVSFDYEPLDEKSVAPGTPLVLAQFVLPRSLYRQLLQAAEFYEIRQARRFAETTGHSAAHSSTADLPFNPLYCRL